jgi:hypothetical protein
MEIWGRKKAVQKVKRREKGRNEGSDEHWADEARCLAQQPMCG